MPTVADCQWLCYAVDCCVLKDTEVVSGLHAKNSTMGVERRKCGSYTPCLFILCVLTLEDRKYFPTQYPPPPSLLAASAHNNVIRRPPSAWPVQLIQSQPPKVF